MINLHVEIQNPWTKDRFKNLGSLHGKISEYKAWELEHTFYDGMLLDLNLKFTTKGDHAGLNIEFGLLGYSIHFIIYDTRHWDYENNTWVKHG